MQAGGQPAPLDLSRSLQIACDPDPLTFMVTDPTTPLTGKTTPHPVTRHGIRTVHVMSLTAMTSGYRHLSSDIDPAADAVLLPPFYNFIPERLTSHLPPLPVTNSNIDHSDFTLMSRDS